MILKDTQIYLLHYYRAFNQKNSILSLNFDQNLEMPVWHRWGLYHFMCHQHQFQIQQHISDESISASPIFGAFVLAAGGDWLYLESLLFPSYRQIVTFLNIENTKFSFISATNLYNALKITSKINKKITCMKFHEAYLNYSNQ